MVFWINIFRHPPWAAWLFGISLELHSKNTRGVVDSCRFGLRIDESKTIFIPNGQLRLCRVYVLWGIDLYVMAANQGFKASRIKLREFTGAPMKAILQTNYGAPDVLQLTEVEKPSPKDDQVLVKVHATSINALDYRLMRANPFFVRLMGGGFWKPKDPRIGRDVAGLVEAVGENVTQFRPGDEVFGCARGTFAEYALAEESYLALKPAGVSFENAAAVPIAALTALQGLRDTGGKRSGQKALIQGASGGVGTFAVQLAKAFGGEVTAVCSTRNIDMARSIGADCVIDYTKEDFTNNAETYDLII
jgi:NADPH:quinone reductase-like Zn-dependent oxidoreductase